MELNSARIDMIASRIKEEKEPDPYEFIILWGEPGVGKSHIATKTEQPVYWIDTERRAAHIYNKSDKEGVKLYQMPRRLNKFTHFEFIVGVIQAIITSEENEPGVIVIDSGTDYCKYGELHFLQSGDAKSVYPETLWAIVYKLQDGPIDRITSSGFTLVMTAQARPSYKSKPSSARLQKNMTHKASAVVELCLDGTMNMTKNQYNEPTAERKFKTVETLDELIQGIHNPKLLTELDNE